MRKKGVNMVQMKRIFTAAGARILHVKGILLVLIILSMAGCSSNKTLVTFHDPNMEFASVQAVAVMPFANFTREQQAADRVRDAFNTMLLATEGVYVIPVGEVARGVSRAGIENPTAPSPEEVVKFVSIVGVDAVITGAVREYGGVRSGTTSANVIAISMEMLEGEGGRLVWAASSTKGGITTWDRLFGGGGDPIDDVTKEAVSDIIDKLFEVK